ncbi:MAG TPA: hypothetical protein VGN44_05005 [Candidatus Angelobacter sp.]|jgi:hypothetical protein
MNRKIISPMPNDANRFVMELDTHFPESHEGVPVEAFRKRLEFLNRAKWVSTNKPEFLENAVDSLTAWAKEQGLTGDDLTIITRGKNKKGEEVDVIHLSEALIQRIHDAIAQEMMPAL